LDEDMSRVIFDGDCPVCTTLKDFVEERDSEEALNFIPFQSEAFQEVVPGLSKKEASQALFIISENGERLRGARAVFEVLSQMPGLWGVIGKMLRLPPFYWIAEPFYRLFARHRHGMGKKLFG
jgi:predicted DCC family thiol-disulfide oxidoreductase YuxK